VDDREHFASVATGLRGYITRHKLAVHYLQTGRLEEAEAQWQQALAEQAGYLPALRGLADVCLARRDGDALEGVIGELRKLPQTELEVEILRARLHQVAGEYGEARAMLEALVAQHPGVFAPLFWLGNVLVEQGRDWAAAERVLRAALAIDPNHPVCRKNLDLVLREQRGYP
jgi:tetratricopeptide (TPR) repeat protein